VTSDERRDGEVRRQQSDFKTEGNEGSEAFLLSGSEESFSFVIFCADPNLRESAKSAGKKR
jgi:hypothetical protein